MVAGLLLFDWLQRIVTFISWKLVIVASTAIVVIGELLTENGIIAFASQFTIDPRTAHYRRLIWRFGTESVEKNPLIGIGFDSYERLSWMPPSVDNQWLLLAMRFGIFPALAMLITVLVALYMLSSRSMRFPEIDRRAFVGIAISLFTVSLLGFSVAYFGGAQTWYYMLLGLAVAIGFASQAARPSVRIRRQDLRERRQHSEGDDRPQPRVLSSEQSDEDD